MLDLAQAVAPPEPLIVVTGRGLTPADPLRQAVTIDRSKILQSPSRRVEDMLRDVAGLAAFRRSDSRSSHPTSQGLNLRGLGGNAASRVTLTLDGVPHADPFGGWIGFAALDAHALDSIRVTRGGGIAGLGGSIEIDSRGVEADGVADAAVAAGSRTSGDARLFTGTRWAQGFASLSGGVSRGGGFIPIVASDRGAADRAAPYRQLWGRARLVTAIGAASEAQFNLSGFGDRRSRGTAFSDNHQRGLDASLRLVGKGATGWSALGYWQERRFASEFAAVGAGRASTTQTLDQSVPAGGWGVRGEVAPTIGTVAFRLGGALRQVTGETREEFRFVAAAPTRRRQAGGRALTAGLFGSAEWRRAGWHAALDLAADRWRLGRGHLRESDLAGAPLLDLDFAPRARWEGSGRLALGRSLGSAVALRAAAYRGWRLATLNELYRPFRAGADATAPNPALDPERLAGVEAGIDWRPSSRARLSATLFANRLNGAIANVTLGEGPGVFPIVGFVAAGGAFRMRRNLPGIISRGIEVDAGWSRGAWRGDVSYALSDARVDAPGTALDGKRPAQVARHAASAALGWSRGRLGLLGTARFAGRQFEDDANSRALGSAVTLDGAARLGVSTHAEVELRVENLTDTTLLASFAGDGTRERAAPRTIWLGLRLR